MTDDILDRLHKAETLTRGPLYSLTVEARIEIERLRALITAWIDAKDAMRQSPPSDITNDLATANAEDALRKAVER